MIERAIDYDAIEKVTLEALKAENNPERDEAVKVEQKVNKANDIVAKKADLAESDKAQDLVHKVEISESSLISDREL